MDIKQKGFTLVELIIVVAIIGILASVVYPSYSGYVLRANRVDAKVALSSLAHLQERYYTENLQYTDDFNDLIPGVADSDDDQDVYVKDANGYSNVATDQDYKIVLSQPGSSTSVFTLTATAVGTRQLKDLDCREFVITHTGQQTAKKSDTSANNSCWEK